MSVSLPRQNRSRAPEPPATCWPEDLGKFPRLSIPVFLSGKWGSITLLSVVMKATAWVNVL